MLPCYTCGCAHTACWAWSFLGFLPVLRPPSGSWSTCSSGSSSPLVFPTFAMGSPLWGRESFVLDRNEGLVSPFGSGALVSFLDGPRTSVCGVSARPVPPGVLPGGPRCVHELWLYLALSSVLHCPMLGLRVASTTLATVLWLSLVPYPRSCQLGSSLGRRLLFAPCSYWRLLSGWSSLKLRVFGCYWISPLCSTDHRSASRPTCSALPPVSRLSFVLGDFSFG